VPVPVPIPVPVPTPTPVPVEPHPPIIIPIPTLPSGDIGKRLQNGTPRGTIEWRQGKKWVVILPPYKDEDKYYLDNPLPGTYKFSVGKGSAAKTLQVLGGSPEQDADIDMGWAQVHISAKGKDLTMSFAGGQDAANVRWNEERQSMAEYDRISYDETPQEPVVQEIPKAKRTMYERGIAQQLRRAKKMGFTDVKYVPESVIHDYGGMNPEVGNQIGYPMTLNKDGKVVGKPMPKDEIHIAEGGDIVNDYETLKHELDEVEIMREGIPYYPAHVDALKRENEISVKPKKITERTYLGHRLRSTSPGEI